MKTCLLDYRRYQLCPRPLWRCFDFPFDTPNNRSPGAIFCPSIISQIQFSLSPIRQTGDEWLTIWTTLDWSMQERMCPLCHNVLLLMVPNLCDTQIQFAVYLSFTVNHHSQLFSPKCLTFKSDREERNNICQFCFCFVCSCSHQTRSPSCQVIYAPQANN